jgi:hypothetical protein
VCLWGIYTGAAGWNGVPVSKVERRFYTLFGHYIRCFYDYGRLLRFRLVEGTFVMAVYSSLSLLSIIPTTTNVLVNYYIMYYHNVFILNIIDLARHACHFFRYHISADCSVLILMPYILGRPLGAQIHLRAHTHTN